MSRMKRSDAEWLRAAREKLGLSQEQLAEELGMTQGNIAWYETGRTLHLPKLVRMHVERMLKEHRLAKQES
jgi:transcriptional regulator with XRE-family HTH domain